MATIQYGVTENGFVRKTLPDILASLNSRFTAAFGSTFDTSPASPDGQIIGIVADEIDQCWNQAEQAFNAYRPGAVSKIGLDNVCELTNTTRIVNKNSQVTVELSGSAGTQVPAGTLVGNGSLEFAIDTDTEIPGDVTAVCTTPGEFYVAPNTVTKIVTEVPGLTGVNNPDAGETGITYEKDPALRARRDKTTAKSGSAFVEALYAALADLNLDYIRIRDNDTGAPIGTQPAGTIYVVVDGGTKNDIAKRIYRAKSGGTPTHGTESITVKDSNGYPHTIKFSRSTKQPIFVKGTFKRRAGANISSNDAAKLLQEAMVNYLNSLQPGEPVVYSALFAPLMAATINIEIDTLFFGIAANPITTTTVELDIDKRAQGIEANIVFEDKTNG